MKQINLSKRLAAIAEYVSDGAAVADIGTDHGYIPVFLAQTRRARAIIASDINSLPLDNARQSAIRYNVSEKIEFILSDGLKNIHPDSVDTIIMAGMGGETITSILSDAAWISEKKPNLIIQPQSKIPDLNTWLFRNSYYANESSIVREDGKLYLIMKCSFSPIRRLPADTELYIPASLISSGDPLLNEYIDYTLSKLVKIKDGLNNAASDNTDEIARIEKTITEIEQIRRNT